jgi:hypothetical protein
MIWHSSNPRSETMAESLSGMRLLGISMNETPSFLPWYASRNGSRPSRIALAAVGIPDKYSMMSAEPALHTEVIPIKERRQ